MFWRTLVSTQKAMVSYYSSKSHILLRGYLIVKYVSQKWISEPLIKAVSYNFEINMIKIGQLLWLVLSFRLSDATLLLMFSDVLTFTFVLESIHTSVNPNFSLEPTGFIEGFA